MDNRAKIIPTILALIGFAVSLSANAGNYFTMEQDDYSNYYSYSLEGYGGDNSVNLELINAEDFIQGSLRQYSHFLGEQGVWLWNNYGSSKFYLYHFDQNRFELFVDFNAPEGTTYYHNFNRCIKTTTVTEKDTSIEINNVTFDDVVRLDFGSACQDSGLSSAYVSKSAGLLQWTMRQGYYSLGAEIFELVDGMRNGNPIMTDNEENPFEGHISFATQIPLVPVSLESEEAIDVSLTLVNPTDSNLLLTFDQGHELDVFILDEDGQVLRQWSENKTFFMGPHDLVVEANSTGEFTATIELMDRFDQPLFEGSYKLRLVLDGYIKNQASDNLNTQPVFFAEYPLTLK